MHELAVAADLLDVVLKTARENGATTVVTARLRIGAGSCLNPDSLAFGFEALATGTPASGCRLEIEHLPAPVTCPACGWNGERLDVAELVCPQCEGHPLRITGGRELTVDTITVE
jgi:hydrogenase nickel incorporation protein HypA/HybF